MWRAFNDQSGEQNSGGNIDTYVLSWLPLLGHRVAVLFTTNEIYTRAKQIR
jgi:hypothetical protein